MKFSIRQEQVGAVAPRAALAGLLLAGSVLAFQTHQATPTSQAAAPRALLASVKPDFRGADGSNNGVLSSTGPTTTPSQVFDAHPTFAGNYTGIELDASNNVVFNAFAGAAYSFPKSGAGVTGTQNWSASTGITGGDASCNSSQIVLSTDGGDYVGADNGSLFQVAPALATGAPGVAPSGSIFTTPSGGIEHTIKIGPDNTLYAGTSAGQFFALTPPAVPTTAPAVFGTATVKWSFNTAQATSKFCSEPAFDPTTGNLYVASSDLNSGTGGLTNGTLYALHAPASGTAATVVWSTSLPGNVKGAVVFDSSLATPTVFVADANGNLSAYNASTGAATSFPTVALGGSLLASPALSPDGQTVYILDNAGGKLRGYNATTGAAGIVATVPSGSTGSPVVDATGNIYIEGSTGDAFGFSAAGTQLFDIPGGTAAGQSGNGGPGTSSPAIAADGTIYFAGKNARTRGFQAAAPPTNTPTATSTATATAAGPTNTFTNTPTNTPTNTATNTPTITNTPTNTSTATNTPTVTLTSTATNTPSAGLPNCQIEILPNPETIQQGGVETVLFKTNPNAQLTVAVYVDGTFPGIATQVKVNPPVGGMVNFAAGVPAGFPTAASVGATGATNFVGLTAGPNGRTLINFPIPLTSPLGKFAVAAQVTNAHSLCRSTTYQTVKNDAFGNPHVVGDTVPVEGVDKFNIEAPQLNSVNNTFVESVKRGLLRSVELTGPDSKLTDRVYVRTAANATVSLVYTIDACKPSPNHCLPGGAADGGTAHAAGDTIATASGTAAPNAKGVGIYNTSVNLGTDLVTPCNGITLNKKVTIVSGGVTIVRNTKIALQEICLHLKVLPKETTRGSLREPWAFGKTHTLKVAGPQGPAGTIINTSTFTLQVVGVKGGHITAASATFGANPAVNASGLPVTLGPGLRSSLKFSVPNTYAPPANTSLKASVTVTETFRGSTKTRTLLVGYQLRP